MSLATAHRDHKRELSGVGRKKKASSPDPYCNIRISYEHSPEPPGTLQPKLGILAY